MRTVGQAFLLFEARTFAREARWLAKLGDAPGAAGAAKESAHYARQATRSPGELKPCIRCLDLAETGEVQ